MMLRTWWHRYRAAEFNRKAEQVLPLWVYGLLMVAIFLTGVALMVWVAMWPL